MPLWRKPPLLQRNPPRRCVAEPALSVVTVRKDHVSTQRYFVHVVILFFFFFFFHSFPSFFFFSVGFIAFLCFLGYYTVFLFFFITCVLRLHLLQCHGITGFIKELSITVCCGFASFVKKLFVDVCVCSQIPFCCI